jgi:uncharacterized membrane protein (DUF106 family)
MTPLNSVLAWTTDVALRPFQSLPPLVGLTAVSLATAVAMLFVFRATSNQAGLAAVKRAIHASIFEIRLFNDDLRAIWRAQLDILRHNLTYLRLSFAPMLWIIVPLTLVIAQLQFHYGYGPILPGEPVVVTVPLRPGARVESTREGLPPVLRTSSTTTNEAISLAAPEQIEVDTAAIWFPGTHEIVWRIKPRAAGHYDLRIRMGGETYVKALNVSGGVARRSPVRPDHSFLNQLLYPSEEPLPDDSPMTAIRVSYPERDFVILGWDVHWMIVYFALSIVFAFVLKKPFNVTL